MNYWLDKIIVCENKIEIEFQSGRKYQVLIDKCDNTYTERIYSNEEEEILLKEEREIISNINNNILQSKHSDEEEDEYDNQEMEYYISEQIALKIKELNMFALNNIEKTKEKK